MSIYILDTRNQKDDFVVKGLVDLGNKTLRSKLPFGDVAKSTNMLNVVDLKSSGGGLIELSKNICSKDHNRLKNEIIECVKYGGNITFLCFEPNITSIEDIANWEVPRFKNNQYHNGTLYRQKGALMTSVKPETLMKAIKTMSEPNHYGVGVKINFVFTTKEDCGRKIVELLGGEQ